VLFSGPQMRSSICDNGTDIRMVSCDEEPLEMRGAKRLEFLAFICVPSYFIGKRKYN